MEKSTRKQIFTIIFAIVLVSAFIGAIQLLCNAIEMLNYSTLYIDEYKMVQKPQAIISMVASIGAFIGIIIGVIVSCKKSKVVEIVCYSLTFIVLILFIVLIIVSNNNWLEYYKEKGIRYSIYDSTKPYYLAPNILEVYSFYSFVMSILISQTVYFGIMSILYFWDLVKTLRKNKSQTSTDEPQQLN